MKTISFFNSTKSWGGGEKWHHDAALYFSDKDYIVHFFLTESSELHKRLKNQAQIHLHYVKVGNLSFLNPFKVNWLKKKFKKLNIDILLMNLPSDVKIAGRAASGAGVKKIIYRRAVPVPIKNTWLNRYIFEHWLTHVLANSKATAKAILENNASLISTDKIKIIHNPIQCAGFINRPFKKIYDRRKDEMIIANIGRLEKEKNHKFLVDLSVALRKTNVDHVILIAGKGSLEKELKQKVKTNALETNFIFMGFLDNVKDLLKSSDIFILPSLWEGFGFVLAEASLCELPVIAFDTSSIPELVINEETGFVVPSNSVKEVADKVILLKERPALLKQLGLNGAKYVKENFDEQEIMQKLESFLNGS